MQLLANMLVLIGAGLLIFSLKPVHQLIAQLSAGGLRRRWYILTILIYSFILGYFIYIAVYWGTQNSYGDLVVPVIFFLGACFVMLINLLSLQTATDVRRITTLEHENITDPLMGIYNRRYLDRMLAAEVSRALRYNLPLSVLLIDIDHFKRINDSYGHQVGDIILTDLANLITGTVRNTDMVARYGGEEILIIAPNTAAATAINLAERLRQMVEVSRLLPAKVNKNQEKLRVTISIGVAYLDQGIRDMHALIDAADKALYRAKHEGRNRVAVNN